MTRYRILLGVAATAVALTAFAGAAHADDQIPGCSADKPSCVMPHAEIQETTTTTSTTTPGEAPAKVLPAVETNGAAPAVVAPTVAAATAAPASSSALPVTGGDVLELTVIGLAALGGGTLLVRRSRRHAA